MTPDVVLRALFDRAVEVADPMRSLAAHLPPSPQGRIVVVGAGKASALVAPDTVSRGKTNGVDAIAMLAQNDAHSFFCGH